MAETKREDVIWFVVLCGMQYGGEAMKEMKSLGVSDMPPDISKTTTSTSSR